LKNLPNFLSVLRLILLPSLYFALKGKYIYTSSILLILVILTDILDGYFARKFSAVTQIGTLLDHGVDKIVSIFLSFLLYFYFGMPKWAFLFFVLRDTLIVLFGLGCFLGLNLAFGSLWLGKVAGGFYYAMAFAYLLGWREVAYWCLLISVFLYFSVLIVYPIKFFPRVKAKLIKGDGS